MIVDIFFIVKSYLLIFLLVYAEGALTLIKRTILFNF